MDKSQEKNILEMAQGAIMERVDLEMVGIINNILDPNTKASSKRQLVVTVNLVPDDDRRMIKVETSAKSKLVATNAISTALAIAPDENGEVTAFEMTAQIPGQGDIFGEVQTQPAKLRLVGGKRNVG